MYGGPLLGEDITSEPILPTPCPVARRRWMCIASSGFRANCALYCSAKRPEVVGAAEDLCEHVVYIPISALGHSPEVAALPGGGRVCSCAQEHRAAMGCRALLYMFAKWTTGLIAGNGAVAANGAAKSRSSATGRAVVICL